MSETSPMADCREIGLFESWDYNPGSSKQMLQRQETIKLLSKQHTHMHTLDYELVLDDEVADIVELEPLPLPLPLPDPFFFFCTTACTTCPAELNTISTSELSGEYENSFCVLPLPRLFVTPVAVIFLVKSPTILLTPPTSCTMLPRLSTRKFRVEPPCVMEPSRPSTAPTTSPTTSPTRLVTLLIVLMRRGLRSSDSKTRETMSTRWPWWRC
jgi:hypothetical protein